MVLDLIQKELSHPNVGFGQNVITFGFDMSFSIHTNNKTKSVLIFGEGITETEDEITLIAERMYSIDFTLRKRKFCSSLHYNRANSYLFVNGTEIIKLKAKDFEIVANPLCLGNILEDFPVANM